MSRHILGPPQAVLFDRDGTLVVDVPYNADPQQVRPMPGAAEALDAVRRAGLRCGVLTNQSGIARGLLQRPQVDAVNARVAELLGPFDLWEVCPHGPADGCGTCRPEVLPAAGLALGPVGPDFLPAMNGEMPGAEVTVRQLLAHTSGLRASTRLDHGRCP